MHFVPAMCHVKCIVHCFGGSGDYYRLSESFNLIGFIPEIGTADYEKIVFSYLLAIKSWFKEAQV